MTTIDAPRKGHYEQIGKFNAYTTGAPTSDLAIITVTDAFGLTPPALIGADLIAEHARALVIVPDLFDGQPAQLRWIDKDGEPAEETREAYMRFVQEKATSPDNLTNVLAAVEAAKRAYPSVNTWIGLGLGWGGKLVAQTSGHGTPFKASGQAYPSKPAKADAEDFVIPHICLASRTDNPDGVKAYKDVLSTKGGYVETFEIYHGWMGARSDLNDPHTERQFHRGYQKLAEWFSHFHHADSYQ